MHTKKNCETEFKPLIFFNVGQRLSEEEMSIKSVEQRTRVSVTQWKG